MSDGEPYVVCVGLATLDTIFEIPHHPDPDGRVVATELTEAGGGPAATAAVTLARLGVKTFFVGSVSDDDVGAKVRRGLEQEGVDVSAVDVVPGVRSPQSSILTNRRSASRTIVHYPGTLDALALSAAARDLCLGAEWVHVDHAGYPAVKELRRQMKISIDGGNPIAGLELDGIALYAPTEPALEELFAGPEEAIAAGAELVVVTRGSDGSFAMRKDGTVVEAPGLRIAPISTLGAGDVFHGALIAQLVDGAPLFDALTTANACAALSCRALDGRSAIPTSDELMVMMP
jgi:sulfofructose kinase